MSVLHIGQSDAFLKCNRVHVPIVHFLSRSLSLLLDYAESHASKCVGGANGDENIANLLRMCAQSLPNLLRVLTLMTSVGGLVGSQTVSALQTVLSTLSASDSESPSLFAAITRVLHSTCGSLARLPRSAQFCSWLISGDGKFAFASAKGLQSALTVTPFVGMCGHMFALTPRVLCLGAANCQLSLNGIS